MVHDGRDPAIKLRVGQKGRDRTSLIEWITDCTDGYSGRICIGRRYQEKATKHAITMITWRMQKDVTCDTSKKARWWSDHLDGQMSACFRQRRRIKLSLLEWDQTG